MEPTRAWLACCLITGAYCCLEGVADAKDPPPATRRKSSVGASPVLVTINGTSISENQLALYRLIHRIPDDSNPQRRRRIIDQLVENELMRQFLIDRRAQVDPKPLASAVETLKTELRRRNLDPVKTLRDLGYNDAALRRDLSLPLAWESHVARILTQQAIRDEFERRRDEYDGTEVRASQIFIKAPAFQSGAKAKEAETKLARIRADIVASRIRFADAARQISEAPSADDGGDVGYFAYRGKMPPEICRVVFSLKPGEVSQPFRTAFGVHLYTVTDRRGGNLNLEDVRPAVIRRLSKELWDQLVAQARGNAAIEWKASSP